MIVILVRKDDTAAVKRVAWPITPETVELHEDDGTIISFEPTHSDGDVVVCFEYMRRPAVVSAMAAFDAKLAGVRHE